MLCSPTRARLNTPWRRLNAVKSPPSTRWCWLYQRQVFNVCYRTLGNTEDAADATQDALLSAFRGFKSFKGSAGGLRGWLLRIAVNTCYDQLRRRQRRPPRVWTRCTLADADPEPTLAERAPIHGPGQSSAVSAPKRRATSRRRIDQLPPEQRLTVILCDVQGLSYDEAAQVMAVELGTVKSRLEPRPRPTARHAGGKKGNCPPLPSVYKREARDAARAHVDDDDLSALVDEQLSADEARERRPISRHARCVRRAWTSCGRWSALLRRLPEVEPPRDFLAGSAARGGSAKRRAPAALVHGHARGGGRAGGGVRVAGRGHVVRRFASRVERRARNRTSPGGASAGGQQPGRRADGRCSCRGARCSSRRCSRHRPLPPAWRRRRDRPPTLRRMTRSPRQPASARSQRRCPLRRPRPYACPSARRLSRLPPAIRSSAWAPRRSWQQFSAVIAVVIAIVVRQRLRRASHH